MSNKKVQYKKLLFEFISVSFAVLLALFVNQWRENHNNNLLGQQAIENIKEEVVDNKEDIIGLIQSHKLLLSTLDSIVRIENTTDSTDVIIGNIEITLINSSAWEMAKVTKAVFYINFNDINTLAKVYNFQSYYESIVHNYILSNYGVGNNNLNKIHEMRSFLNSIIPMEENLKIYYERILKEVLI